MRVQEVRWDKGGTEPADYYTFLYGIGNADHHLGTVFLVHKGIRSGVKKVEVVGDRMYYIMSINRINVMLERT
jgi:hypothetical protein